MKTRILRKLSQKLVEYIKRQSADMVLRANLENTLILTVGERILITMFRTYRKKMNKNKILGYVFSIGIIILVFSGCSRKLTPAVAIAGRKVSYDTATFDYIYTEGLKQKLLGNPSEALGMFEQCLKINPESDAVNFQIAQVALQGGDIKNGKKYAEKAVELNERNVWYLTLLGNIYVRQNNLDSAALYYEKAVKYFPAKENLKINLGNIYTEKGSYRKANEIYSYLEQKYGESNDLGLYIVRNLVNEGEYKAAEEKVNKLIEDYPEELIYNGLLAEIYRKEGRKEKAAEVYQKLIEDEPDNPQTLFSLIDFLRTENEYEEFFGLLNNVILNENISREDKLSLFTDIVGDDTLIKYHGRELEMTLLIFESRYSGDDIISLLRPELYLKQGKQNEAVERLNELIKEKPGNYYAWEKLLLTYSDIGDYDNLFIKGKECATRFNMSYLAKILYASAAMEKKENDIALEELRKAKILAGNQNELIVQVLTMEADVYYRKKNFQKAFETFSEALKMNPDDLIVLNNYAYYLAEQDMNLKQAEEMAKFVIDREKENTTYLDTYAWILYKRGKKKEAARIMESIILNNKEEDPEWLEHYGYILQSLGKCKQAVIYWEKALEMDPGKEALKKEIKNCTRK